MPGRGRAASRSFSRCWNRLVAQLPLAKIADALPAPRVSGIELAARLHQPHMCTSSYLPAEVARRIAWLLAAVACLAYAVQTGGSPTGNVGLGTFLEGLLL